MTKKEILGMLKKRLSFLELRVKSTNKDLSFDRAEISALKFAIYRIENPLLDEAIGLVREAYPCSCTDSIECKSCALIAKMEDLRKDWKVK